MKAFLRLGRLSAQEYEYLHAGLSSTAKGRTFLAEYLANNREEDVRVLASALERMERHLYDLGAVLQPQRISGILRQVAIDLKSAPDPTGDANSDSDAEDNLREAMSGNIQSAVSELTRLADAMDSLKGAIDECASNSDSPCTETGAVSDEASRSA